MENLKEIAGLILLQVDHNRECGKDDKFTVKEIADIIHRRVVLKLHKPVVNNLVCEKCNSGKIKVETFCYKCSHTNTKYSN